MVRQQHRKTISETKNKWQQKYTAQTSLHSKGLLIAKMSASELSLPSKLLDASIQNRYRTLPPTQRQCQQPCRRNSTHCAGELPSHYQMLRQPAKAKWTSRISSWRFYHNFGGSFGFTGGMSDESGCLQRNVASSFSLAMRSLSRSARYSGSY